MRSATVGTSGDPTTTFYVRDAQGNNLAVYEQIQDASSVTRLWLREQSLYGSERLGVRKPDLLLVGSSAGTTPTGAALYTYGLG